MTGLPTLGEQIQADLAVRLREWFAEAAFDSGGRTLSYRATRTGTTIGLLREPGEDWRLFTCLNSLRDVEPQVNLILREGTANRDAEPPFVAMPTKSAAEEHER